MSAEPVPLQGDLPATEAFDVLRALADRKAAPIPAEVLARHVLKITAGAGWPVQRAAMEAALRRVGAARQDRLEVARVPAAGLGIYTLRARGTGDRPYKTLLEGIDPLRASCDCRDYVRNSLGLCKHVLAVVAGIFGSRRSLRAPSLRPSLAARLTWNPIRPLTGWGHWLERVHLVLPDRATRGLSTALRRRFIASAGGPLRLRSVPHDPAARLALIDDLSEAARRGDVAADPALAALLRHEREAAGLLRSRPETDDVRGVLRTLRRPLYRYQEEGLRRFLASGRLLLADDMGLGKTAQAIAACHVLLQLRKVRRGLLIVPASLKDQWRREWGLFSDAPVAIVEGSPAERTRAYAETSRGFLIANYEQVLRDLDTIRRFEPDLVVLDEAQRIKNWATKTAAYVKALQPPYRLVLTGTPMENRLEELASLLDWVDDMALEPKWRLLPFHTRYADGRREVVGAAHLDTLRARLSGCVLRRSRSEVLEQLPSRTDTVVPVAITEEQAAAHTELDAPIARLLGIARKRPLTQSEFLRLMSLLTTQRIIANGIALYEFVEMWPALSRVTRPDEARLKELGSPKLGHLRDILAQVAVEQRRKVVVFSQWRRMLTLAHWAVRDLLEAAGLRAAFFTGTETSRRRTQNIVEFHDGDDVRVLFATDAGGVGLNLQRAASACVNLDLPWNPAVLEQRIGRIYRMGQRRPINVYNLVTESSIEARIAGLVADKKALFTGLFDGESSEVRFEHSSSFLSRLERLVTPARAPEAAPDEDLPEPVDAENEAERLAPGPEETDAAVPDEGGRAPRVCDDVRGLLGHLRVQRRKDGVLAIEATPEAAEGLAALFEGMALLLRQQA